MISPSEFIHPDDAAALHQLENIPDFPGMSWPCSIHTYLHN